ncbi:MAG: hypothetical protein K6C99_09130 [Lachnospiraceae bacterium]|nr:hypothetical protein [Lachnospiraceae bacterium]
MKEAKVTIGATNIKTFKYENSFAAKSGDPLKMAVKTQMAVRLNPEAPTTAMVLVKFETSDEEKKIMAMELETVTPVSVSTFVDNLDDVIKKKYFPQIMMAVNEKIRIASSIVGLNIQTPPVTFMYTEDVE